MYSILKHEIKKDKNKEEEIFEIFEISVVIQKWKINPNYMNKTRINT